MSVNYSPPARGTRSASRCRPRWAARTRASAPSGSAPSCRARWASRWRSAWRSSYEALAKDLLSGRADAAWAPPFVCARTEAMGVRVLVRGVRLGMSSYRSALVARAGSGLTLERLKGTTAAWVDRDAVAGYLLPVAYLKSQGVEPPRAFAAQHFTGSYRGALEAVLSGHGGRGGRLLSAGLHGPHLRRGRGEGAGRAGWATKFELIAYTEEAPNDGVPVAMNVPPQLANDAGDDVAGAAPTRPTARSCCAACSARTASSPRRAWATAPCTAWRWPASEGQRSKGSL